jgi:transposase
MVWEPPITEESIARLTPEAQAIIRLLLARIAEQDRQLAALQSRVTKLEAVNAQLRAENAELRAENAQLRAENAELRAELKAARKTPQNSSLPPSTQHPHAKPAAAKPKSKRKPGGQPGHPKAERALIPSEQCTSLVPLKPDACRRCGHALSGSDPTPLRHQVCELPEIKPIITEYQRHRLTCPRCRETTCAALPPGVPTGQSGPRLVAFVATLMAHFRQSKRRTALFVTSVLNIPCSPALTVKHQNLATQALRPAYDALAAALPAQPYLCGDESPTKQGQAKAWLWTFVAGAFTVFALRGSRAATALTELLGEGFAGVMSCDRAKMYWQCGRLQWCWAHLKRDFQALIDHRDSQVKRLGHDLMRPTRVLFRQWSRCRDGTLSRAALQREMAPFREQVENLLLRGKCSGNARLKGMCDELHKHRDRLWTFLEVEGVEPTNNAAERSLRQAVIWRKLSFGTQSAAGSRFVETMLTVIETCRQQNRNVLDYTTQALTHHFQGQPTPSLRPRA